MARAMVVLRLGIGLAALTLIAVAINVMGSSVSSLHVSTSTVGISLNPYPVGISLNPYPVGISLNPYPFTYPWS